MVDLEVRQCRQIEDQTECDERCDRGKAFEVMDVLDLGEAFGDIRLRCETLERVPFSSRLSLKVHRSPMTRVPFGVSASDDCPAINVDAALFFLKNNNINNNPTQPVSF